MKRKNKFLIIAFALVVFLSLGVRNVNANESVIKAEAVKDMYYVTDHFDEDPDYEDYSYKLIYDFDIRGNVVLDADEELCNYLGIEPKDGKCITKTTASYEGGGYITKIKINGVDINDGKIDPYNYDGDEYEDENIFDHTDYIYYYGTGEDIEIADGVIVNRTFKKVNNKILVTYKLTNNSGKKITYDLGIATDTYFLKNDRAALFIEDNKKGITITQDNKDSSDYLGYGAQFFINFDSPVTTAWLGDYCNNDDTYYYEHSFDNSDVNHISNIDGAATWSWHDTILDGESSEKTVSFGSSITYERKIKYKDPETGDEIEEDSLIGGAFELPDLGEIDTVPAGYRQAWMQKRGDEITELDSNIAIVPDNPDTEVLYYTDIIPIKYKIHFNTNGGERIDTIFYTLNDIINLPEAKKIGYKFTGWKVIETDNEEKWTVGSTLNGTLSNSFMGDVTLKAQYEYKEYVLTIHDVNGLTINPKGVKNVLYGADEEINIVAEDRIAITSIKVNGAERLQDLSNNKLILENIKEDTEVIIEVKELLIEFDEESKNKVFNVDSKGNLSFRIINTNLQNFTSKDGKVYIDNVLLEQDKYTLKSGSVIITLNEDFAKTLELGKHELKVTFNDDKEIKTDFELVKKVVNSQEKSKNPQTGDNIVMYSIVFIVALLGITTFVVINKRKKVTK